MADPNIGICDSCGAEDSSLRRGRWDHSEKLAWLCAACDGRDRLRAAASTKATPYASTSGETHVVPIKPPAGFQTCNVYRDRRQVSHLVRSVNGGTPGPTMCGLTRFDSAPGAKDADLPGWSMGGGVSGPGVEQVPCPACFEPDDYPRHPLADQFTCPTWDKPGRCVCGAKLPPQEQWHNAGSAWQHVQCKACGFGFVDEDDYIAFYEDGLEESCRDSGCIPP